MQLNIDNQFRYYLHDDLILMETKTSIQVLVLSVVLTMYEHYQDPIVQQV